MRVPHGIGRDMKAIRLLIAHSSLKTLHDRVAVLIIDRPSCIWYVHHPNLLLPTNWTIVHRFPSRGSALSLKDGRRIPLPRDAHLLLSRRSAQPNAHPSEGRSEHRQPYSLIYRRGNGKAT